MSPTSHHKNWASHPAVPTGKQLTFGEHAADLMKGAFSTWGALLGFLAYMGVWMLTDGFGSDQPPWIALNLQLSCIAGLQCFILLIAGKRQDAINAALAAHDREILAEIHRLVKESKEGAA